MPKRMLLWLDKHKSAPRQMADVIEGYANWVKSQPERGQGRMDGMLSPNEPKEKYFERIIQMPPEAEQLFRQDLTFRPTDQRAEIGKRRRQGLA